MNRQAETIDRADIVIFNAPVAPDTLSPFATPDEPDQSLPFGFLYAHSYGHHQRQLWQTAWDEAQRRWLYSGRRHSDKTRRLYSESVSLWRVYLAEQHAIYHLWQATDREAAAWLTHLSAVVGNAPRTVAVRAAAVSSLYLYAKSTRTLHAGREISLFIDAHGSSRDNPFSSALVSRPKVEQYSDSERIPKEAYQWIINYLGRCKPTPSTLRNRAILLTFGFTGWRAEEVLSMTWERLSTNPDHPGQYTYRWTGKARAGNFETRSLPATVVDAITAYLQADGRWSPGTPQHIQPGDYIWRPTTIACTVNFPNVAALDENRHITASTLNDILHRLLLRYFTEHARSLGHTPAAAAVIAKQSANKYSVHSLRHMHAWNLYQAKGKDIRYVADKLGHKNVATTMKYLKSLDKPEDDYSAALAAQLGLGI